MADFGFLIRMNVKIYKTTVKYLSSSEIPAIKKGRALLRFAATDFYVQSSGISGQLTATSDHPVAGNQDWQGITAVGHTYRPAGFYISASACQFTIGDRGAIRNLL